MPGGRDGLVAVTHVFESGETWFARLAVLEPGGETTGLGDVVAVTGKQAEALLLLLRLAREG